MMPAESVRRIGRFVGLAALVALAATRPALAQVEVAHVRLVPGLNLVTAPLDLTHKRPSQVLTGVSPLRVARFLTAIEEYAFLNPVAPTSDFDFIPGRALWVSTNAEANLFLNGVNVAGESYSVDLSGDTWTLAGIPTPDPVTWDAQAMRALINDLDLGPAADNPDIVPPYAWLWNATRQQYVLVADAELQIAGSTQTIPSGSGFWLHEGTANVGSGQAGLKFVFGAAGRARPARPVPGTWSLQLQAGAAGRPVGSAVLGVATALRRPLEIAAPPSPLAGEPVLQVVGGGGRGLYGRIDSSPVTAPREWRLRLVGVGEPLTIRWPDAARALPAGLTARLSDPVAGRAVSLAHAGSLTVDARPGEPRELVLSIAPTSGAALAVSLSAHPGRGRGASFGVTLSQPASVKLVVRGLGGRVVRELRPGELPAGTAAVAWTGTDSSGRQVPAGTYRVEVVAVGADGAQAGASTLLPLR